MNLIHKAANYFASAAQQVETKRAAVKGGKLNFREVHNFIEADKRLGKTVLWKKGGANSMLSTHGFSKMAGLRNYVTGSRSLEKSMFIAEMVNTAHANQHSDNVDVRGAAWYVLDQWKKDGFEVTQGLQISARYLAEAQEKGELL